MSSGSESDDEYVPGEPEQVSEEDSADEETDIQFEKEQEQKATKRKVTTEKKGKKRQKTTRAARAATPEEEEIEEEKEELEPEEQKKREEDLWAMFLDGTDTVKKTAPKETNVPKEPTKTTVDEKKDKANGTTSKPEEDAKAKERRIFEFAGETIVVEDNVIKEKIKTPIAAATGIATLATASKIGGPSKKGRVSGGLSSILGQIGKSNQLSTLEKSKLDWQTYKQVEGVAEEVESHNKGKDGYLDRKDFLERADMRQYELERELRMSRRSNR